MNISIPDSLREFVETQVRELGYNSASEYVRELLSDARARATQETELKELVKLGLEQLRKGDAVEFDDASLATFFEEAQSRARKRLAQKKESPSRMRVRLSKAAVRDIDEAWAYTTAPPRPGQKESRKSDFVSALPAFCYLERVNGIEPSTTAVATQGTATLSASVERLTESTAERCTRGCTDCRQFLTTGVEAAPKNPSLDLTKSTVLNTLSSRDF